MAKGKEMNLAVSISGKVDKSFTSAISAATKSIGGFAGGVAKIGGAALLGGAAAITAIGTAAIGTTTEIVQATGAVAEYGDNIDKMSQKMGISAEAYQEWDAIMQHSGTSIEALKPSMKTLATQAEKGNEAFQKLGISQSDVKNLSQEDLFAKTIAGLQNMEEGTERTYLAGQLLGKGATELGALLNTSAEDTEAMRKRVHELGGVLSNDAVKAAAAYQDQLQDMQTAFSGLQRNLLANFMPSITTVMGGLTDIFSGNYDAGIATFSQGIDEVAAKITDTIPVIAEKGTGLITNLISGNIANFPKLFNIGTQVITGLVNAIVASLPALGDAGAQVIESLGSTLNENVPTILNAVPELLNLGITLIGYLAQGIMQAAPMILSTAGSILMFLVNGIITYLPVVLTSASLILTSLIQGISTQLPALLNTGMTIILGLVQGIASSLPTIATCAINIITSLIMGLLPALPNVLTMGTQIINTLVNGVISTISAIAQLAPTIIKTLVQGLIQNLPAIIVAAIKMGMEIPINLATGVIQALPGIASAVWDIYTFFWDTLLSTDWLALGEEIINGIVDGVKNNVSKIGDAVMSVVNGTGSGDSGAKEAGAEMATSVASGFDASSADISSSIESMMSGAFTSVDTSAALKAGSAMSDDFLSGLTTPTNTEIDLSALTAGIETQFTDLGTTAGTDITSGLTTQFTNSLPELDTSVTTMTDSMNTQFSTGFTNIKTTAQTAMTELTNLVTTEAQKAAEAIKQAFEGMTITIPKPKIPQITATYTKVEDGMGGSVNVPNFAVNWNAMGGIFDKATVFNTSQGLQGAGEKGPEALLPLDTLWSHLEGAMAGAGGMNVSYSPSYTINGNSDDFRDIAAASQRKFEKMMEEYEKKRSRVNFSRW